jgi:thiol-disulfide isomerase/thioredoxin
MKIFKISACIVILLGFCLGPFSMPDVSASENTTGDSQALTDEESGELYRPSGNALADLGDVIDMARRNDKLVLVVMGANWCHDSRALAARLYEEPLLSLVREHYETIFIDVGYLDKGKDVINSLGLPVYYATPTVLIVDPQSGKLVNTDNRHLWADAYNVSMEDSVEYFQNMARSDLTSLRAETVANEELAAVLAQVDDFEQRQADRLYRAYGVLGPMLREYKEGNEQAFSETYWNEVRDFRYKLAVDIDALRAEAHQRVTAGETDIKLDYPQYQAFAWEAEG